MPSPFANAGVRGASAQTAATSQLMQRPGICRLALMGSPVPDNVPLLRGGVPRHAVADDGEAAVPFFAMFDPLGVGEAAQDEG